MNKNYCVYKHTTPSNKVYIGITSQNPLHRWNSGKGYKNNNHFWNAIIKYGWDNIKHEILFDKLSKNEACKKEVELIAYYKSNNPSYGYNHSIGGEFGGSGVHTKLSKETIEKIKQNHKGTRGYKFTEQQKQNISNSKNATKKRVKCIELNLVFPSLAEAAKHFGVNYSNISSCCHGKLKTSNGYHWGFVYD